MSSTNNNKKSSLNGSATTSNNNNNNGTNNNNQTPATSTVLYSGLLYIPTPVTSGSSKKPSSAIPNISCKEYYCELYAQVSTTSGKSTISLSSLGTMFAYYTGTLSSSSAPQVQHFLNLFEKPPPEYLENLTDNNLIINEKDAPSSSTRNSVVFSNPLPPIVNTNPSSTSSSSILKTSSTSSSSVQPTPSASSFMKNPSLPILSETMKPTIQISLSNVAVRIDPMEGYFYYCFELISPTVVYKFFCRSEQEMKRWSEIIEKVSPICKENALIEEFERKIVELERSCNTKKQLTHNNEIRHYRMKYYHHILPSSSGNLNSSSSGMIVNNNLQRRHSTFSGDDETNQN